MKFDELIERYKRQNTKGLKGIIKIFREEKGMLIYKLRVILYKLKIKYEDNFKAKR